MRKLVLLFAIIGLTLFVFSSDMIHAEETVITEGPQLTEKEVAQPNGHTTSTGYKPPKYNPDWATTFTDPGAEAMEMWLNDNGQVREVGDKEYIEKYGEIDPKVIIGSDDRKQVNNTINYPYSTIAYLLMSWENGTYTRCTGTMISPDTVLSAAHCFKSYSSFSDRGDLLSVRVAPGKDGNVEPFGYSYASTIF